MVIRGGAAAAAPPARGRTAGGLGRPLVDRTNRATPYLAKSRNPNLLTQEEVDDLVRMDLEIEALEKKNDEINASITKYEEEARDKVDKAKGELRRQMNASELQAAKAEGEKALGELEECLRAEIAAAELLWNERDNDPEVNAKIKEMEEQMAALKKENAKARKEYDDTETMRQKAENDGEELKADMRRLDEMEIQQQREIALLKQTRVQLQHELERAQDECKRQCNSSASMKAVAEEKVKEVETAEQQRIKMQRAVDRMSNSVRCCVWLRDPVPAVACGGDLDGRTVTVQQDSAKPPAQFEFDRVAAGDFSTLSEPLKSATAKAKGTVLFCPASTCHDGFFGMREGLIWGLRELTSAGGAVTMSAVELYSEQLRDLLVDDRSYHDTSVLSGGDAGEFEVVDGRPLFKGVQSLDATDEIIDRVVANAELRFGQGTITKGNLSVVVSFSADGNKQLHLAFLQPLPTKGDEGAVPHALTCVAKMASDAKEAKQMLKRSHVGRYLASLLFQQESAASVVALTTPNSTTTSAVEALRVLHRCSMVDLQSLR